MTPVGPGRDPWAALLAPLVQAGVGPGTLAAVRAVPRDRFLPAAARPAAWEDRALPIGCGQTCSQPLMVAVVTEALEITGGERALEVGAGSGYQAAVLRAAGVATVVAIEWWPQLAARARATLSALGVTGVEVRLGDGGPGAPDRAPFDCVVVSAAAPAVPRPLLGQLAPGGRLCCPVTAAADLEQLWRVRRRADGGLTWDDLGPCRFVPLRGAFGQAPATRRGEAGAGVPEAEAP